MKVKQAKAKTLPLRKRDNRFFKSILLVVMALAVFNSTMAKAYYDTYGPVIVEHIFEDNNNAGGERDTLLDNGGIKETITVVSCQDGQKPSDNTNYPAQSSKPTDIPENEDPTLPPEIEKGEKIGSNGGTITDNGSTQAAANAIEDLFDLLDQNEVLTPAKEFTENYLKEHGLPDNALMVEPPVFPGYNAPREEIAQYRSDYKNWTIQSRDKYYDVCSEWLHEFIHEFKESVPSEIDDRLLTILPTQAKGNTETEREAYRKAFEDMFKEEEPNNPSVNIYDTLYSMIYDTFKENTKQDTKPAKDFQSYLDWHSSDKLNYVYGNNPDYVDYLKGTLQSKPQLEETAPPVDLDEEAQGARDQLVKDILDASESGHITTENAEEVAAQVEQLIDETNKQNLWAETRETDGYNGHVNYQVAITDESMEALEKAGYKTTSLRIQIKVVNGDGNNPRIYVSIDNGTTWEATDPLNTKEYNPAEDYTVETVYTYLHVLESKIMDPPEPPEDPPEPPEDPPKKPEDPPKDPDPVIDVPQTGDISYPWYAVAILSACGLAAVPLHKKREEA